MIRRYTIKKLSVTTLALLVILLYMIFPVKNKDEFNTKVNYVDNDKLDYIYLNDRNNYLSLTMINIESSKEEEKLIEKLNILTKNGIYKDKVPNNFNAIIPEGTKILSLSLDKELVTVDFSKELLNVSSSDEEKMIESIIFTLTENSKAEKVIIKVNGEVLSSLPNSKKYLPSPLTRKYGINKKYDITSLSNITVTTIFYMSKIDDDTYYTPVSLFTNDDRDKVSIIIDELQSTSVYQDNLKSYLKETAKLEDYEQIDDIMYLFFNEGIYDDEMSKEILEEVKYTISASIKENYDVTDVVIKTK